MAGPFQQNDPKAQLYQILAESGRTSFSGSAPPMPPPFPGANLFGPRLAPILPMLVPGISEFFRGQAGGFAFNFDGNYNVLQAFESRRYMEEMNRVRRDAATADTPIIQDFLYGAYRMGGGKAMDFSGPGGRANFGSRTNDALDRMSGAMTQMLPFLAAVAPDSIDSLAGGVGLRSAAADLFQSGSRYIVDAQGRAGNVDASKMLTGVFANVYANKNMDAMSGLGSRRTGELFQELSNRGLIGGGDVGDTKKAVADASSTLKEYAEAIGAVRDLFAANGRANAPMAELVASLKSLTGTGVGAARPKDLAATAREIQGAARFSPLGLEGLVQYGAMGGQAAGQLGLRSAVLGDMPLMAAAAGQSYAGLRQKESAELLDRDAFTRAEAGRYARGAASPMGNLVGAVLAQAGYAGENTELGRLAARLKAGDMPAELSRPDAAGYLAGVAARSGLDAGAFTRQVFYAQGSNQSALARNRAAMGAVTRTGQRNDLAQLLSGLAGSYNIPLEKLVSAVMAQSSGATGDDDLGRKVAAALGNPNLAQQLGTAFGELSQFSANMNGVSGDAALPFTVTNMARGLESGGRQQGAREQFRQYGEIAKELTKLGRGTMLGRAFQEVMGAGMGAEGGVAGGLLGSAMRVLGMVSGDDVAKNLAGAAMGALPGFLKTDASGKSIAGTPGEVRLAPNQKLNIVVTGTLTTPNGGQAVLNAGNAEAVAAATPPNTPDQMTGIRRGFARLRGEEWEDAPLRPLPGKNPFKNS